MKESEERLQKGGPARSDVLGCPETLWGCKQVIFLPLPIFLSAYISPFKKGERWGTNGTVLQNLDSFLCSKQCSSYTAPSHWFPCKDSYVLTALKPSFNT